MALTASTSWCAEHLPHLDEKVWQWVSSDDFDRLLRQTVRATYPAHEQEQFVAHFRDANTLPRPRGSS